MLMSCAFALTAPASNAAKAIPAKATRETVRAFKLHPTNQRAAARLSCAERYA